jgi:hypothetical protein
VLRKEVKTALNVIGSLSKDCGKIQKEIVKENTENVRLQKVTEQIVDEILAKKKKSADEQEEFERELEKLKHKMKETDSMSRKSKMSTASVEKPKAKRDLQKEEEFNNPALLIKKREEKWAANNKEKKHLMDKYIKNIKVIDDAFNQIKEKTGIESNEEIVTTFIKSEEQTDSLYNYVNALNSDIDTIEEANNNIKAEIEKLNIMNMSEKEREDHIRKL